MPHLQVSRIWSTVRGKRLPKSGNNRLPTEILQEIFSYLDMWTLLRCRDVCRFWQHCIPGDSPALRETMFLPQSKQPVSPATQPIKLRLHVHIEGEFKRTEAPQRTREYAIRSQGGKYLHYLGTWYDGHVNPMLYFDMTRVQLKRYHAAWNEAGSLKPFWLTMQVGQPPIQDIAVHIVFRETTVITEECWVRRHEVTEKIHNPQGVTLGEMLSKTYDMIWWPEVRLRVSHEKDVRLFSYKGLEAEGWEEERNDDGEVRRFVVKPIPPSPPLTFFRFPWE